MNTGPNPAAMTTPDRLAFFRAAVGRVVDLAETYGVIITVTRAPLQPPMMGNHESLIDVYPSHSYRTGRQRGQT